MKWTSVNVLTYCLKRERDKNYTVHLDPVLMVNMIGVVYITGKKKHSWVTISVHIFFNY